jgi:hypothetical protein
MKLMGFDRGVTLLGGFPFPICTPSHGTGYDIAGQGIVSIGASRALCCWRRKWLMRRWMARAAIPPSNIPERALPAQTDKFWFQVTSGDRLACGALWIADGTTPKYFRNTRLKCEELEKPHEKATSVMVFPQ